MKILKIISLVYCLIFVSCYGSYEERIRIDGSSTLYPLTEAVAEDFRNVYPEIKITVGVSGTGGGFKKFSRGEIDIANASRRLTNDEKEICRKNNINFIEIPVCKDGLVIAVNPNNTFVDYLTVAELKRIWEPAAEGKIMYWNQIRSNWPHIQIQLFGAGYSSGSFDFFTKKIIGLKTASRGDVTASEDDNVLVQGVSGALGGLGYFGLSYFIENQNKLKAVPIDDEINSNGIGAISPSSTNISNGKYQPLSRTEYLYINAKSAKKEIVKTFINYYIVSAAKLTKEVGGIALSKASYIQALNKFEKHITESNTTSEIE